jgi:MFS family permease
LAPFFAGFINDGAGWAWVMYFGAICLGVSAVIQFFFMEETIYFRNTSEGTVLVDSESKLNESHQVAEITSQETANATPKPRLSKYRLITLLPDRPTTKQTFLKSWRSLKIIVLFPNIAWAGLLYGTNLSWYMVLNATMSPILNAAPYNFAPRMVGVAYLSPFIAAVISCFWAGRFADWIALFMARRNHGIREAEQRLWALILSAILLTTGLILWGVGASQQLHYMVLIFGVGLVTFGVVCGGAVSLAYAVDCFKEITGETMVSIMIIRNTLGFAFGYAITPWIESLGLRDCFISVAMISCFCTLSFLAMRIWGKSLRRMSANRYWKYVAAERASGVSSGH